MVYEGKKKETVVARKHKFQVAILALVASLVIGGTALAEGSWTSYYDDVRVGKESRTWNDKDLDNVDTSVNFQTCRDSQNPTVNNDSVTIELWRHVPIWPDDKIDPSKTLVCYYSSTVDWSSSIVPSGDYHFTIEYITGSDHLANSVDVGYIAVSY